MVQMQRFCALWRDGMNVDAHQPSCNVLIELSGRFFDHLTARDVDDGCVVRFDVAAWKEPSIEAAVVDQKDPIGGRPEHYAGTSDMPGSERQTR